MKELRVGVVGVGYLGRFHAEKYARMDGVKLAGVVALPKGRKTLQNGLERNLLPITEIS